MPRPKNKLELLDQNEAEFKILVTLIEKMPDELKTREGLNGAWSVKDLAAHLHAWHELFLKWYEQGMRGQKPLMPAPGFTWKQTPALNEKIYREYKDWPYDKVMNALKSSYRKLRRIIENHDDTELFMKKKYLWTGSTSMGSYLISDTVSHYQWAIALIEDFIKNN